MDPQQQGQPENTPPYDELPVANLTPKHKSSPLVKILMGIAALAVIGIILLIVTSHKAAAPTTTKTTSAKQTTTTAAPSGVTKISSSTKRFDSTDLSLGFDYPADWSVSDPGSGKLSVISPMLELTSANNQTVKARIVMSIQNQQTTIAQFAANTAVSVIQSQKLTYKTPTTDQRAQTYLTFVNYAGGSKTIDALYITGDNGYTAGQDVPQSDIVKDDPLINVSFFACADTTCSNYNSATSIATSAWAESGLSKPLVNMLQSLEID